MSKKGKRVAGVIMKNDSFAGANSLPVGPVVGLNKTPINVVSVSAHLFLIW